MSTQRYYVSVVPGLEAVATAELVRRAPGVMIAGTEPGRVHFGYGGPAGELLAMRTVEDVFAYVTELGDLPRDEAGLEAVEDALRRADLRPALAAHRSVREQPADPSFRVTGSREGQHEFTSLQVGARAGAGVVDQCGWRVDLVNHDIDIWVEVSGARAVAGMRLSTDDMKHRSRVSHGPAATNPTVAHAMCLLTEPTAGEVFLDPMCGCGTILVEREAALPGATLLGGDWHGGVLGQAATNLDAAAIAGRLLRANACDLPLRAGSVDKAACNLPWGRRIGSPGSNRRLYPRVLAELSRVVRPGGVVVLLSLQRRLMEAVLAERPEFELREKMTVNLGGLQPSIYVLART